MSGILLRHSIHSVSSAAIALPGDPAAGSRRQPALSLVISGGVHAAALALFLLASARSGEDAVRAIPVRVLLQPPIDLLRLERFPERPAPSGRSPDQGMIDPVAPRDASADRDIDIVTTTLPVDGTEPIGDPSAARDPGGGEPALPAVHGADEGNPDMPSLYDEPPVPIVAPEPRYPDWEREAGIEGRVIVEALVARDGRVLRVRVTEGEKGLSEEAVKAVRAWKFRPARWNGRPVAAWVAIPILFRLR